MLTPLDQFRAEVRHRRDLTANDHCAPLFVDARLTLAVAMDSCLPPMVAGELIHHASALVSHVGKTDVDQREVAREIRGLLAAAEAALGDILPQLVAGETALTPISYFSSAAFLSEAGARAPGDLPAAGNPPCPGPAAREKHGADCRSAAGAASDERRLPGQAFTILPGADRDNELAAIEAFVKANGVNRDAPRPSKPMDLEEACRRLEAAGHRVEKKGHRGIASYWYELDGARMGSHELRRRAAKLLPTPTQGPEGE